MTEVVQTAPRSNAFLHVIRRIPATLTLIAAILVVGVVFAGLWSSFEESPLFETVAYGLPALLEGRWWTPITGTFFVSHPLVYLFTIASFIGMAYLEFRRGSRVALAYFGVGQLFAIFASALLLWLFAFLPWPWAQQEALALDVGASGGTMACIAAAAGLLAAPWRVRAWALLLGFVFVDAVLLGIARRSRARSGRAAWCCSSTGRCASSARQCASSASSRSSASWRCSAIDILTFLVPTDGPFGHTDATDGSIIDIAIDAVIILVIANGLRRGRRWAWVLGIILGSFNVLSGVLFVTLLFIPGATIETGVGDVSVAIAQSAIWLVLLVYLIWVRGAFRARRKATIGIGDEPDARRGEGRRCARHGGGTLSWMTTWGGNSYARTTGGIVAYQQRAGVAIVLADPLGPAASRAESVDGVHRDGASTPASSPASSVRAMRRRMPFPRRGAASSSPTTRSSTSPDSSSRARRWAAVRTSINRAGREEVTFRMTRLHDESWGVQQQLRAISEMWVGDKGLPEMGFTLGTLDEAMDPEVRLAIAVSTRGRRRRLPVVAAGVRRGTDGFAAGRWT